ncbi:MAG: DUF4184 family protein [Proteobacteria bacterium]|nr:DUF4184 family protein [Pseudomonadota bacterium]
MPFTISHAAVVLPFARILNRWRMLSAVVIGAMVPDFAFLLPWQVARVQSHSIVGLFAFCLPIGLASYWLFEYVVKPAAWEVLPDAAYWRSRELARPDPILRPVQWLIAAVGILAGAVTHLAWDAFTHPGTRGARLFPALEDPLDIAGRPMPAFQIAQHASSVLGLALVIYLLWRDMRPAAGAPVHPARALDQHARRRWMLVYVVAALLFCAVSVKLTWLRDRYGRSPSFILSALAVGGLRGLLFSLLAVSALIRVRLLSMHRR